MEIVEVKKRGRPKKVVVGDGEFRTVLVKHRGKKNYLFEVKFIETSFTIEVKSISVSVGKRPFDMDSAIKNIGFGRIRNLVERSIRHEVRDKLKALVFSVQ